MNKQLITRRFSKASATYEAEAAPQRRIADKMAELLADYFPYRHPRVLEVGCGTGYFSRLLLQHLQPRQLLLNDICPEMQSGIEDLLQHPDIDFRVGDAETAHFPAEQELIASCSALQWFAEVDKFFARCHHLLLPGGYLAFTTFGPQNLKEVSTITGGGLRYYSRAQLEAMLSNAGYESVYSAEEIITERFDSPLQVLYHLKHTGVTGLSRQAWTRRHLTEFCDRYTRLFAINTFVSLTWHPIYIIVKKKV